MLAIQEREEKKHFANANEIHMNCQFNTTQDKWQKICVYDFPIWLANLCWGWLFWFLCETKYLGDFIEWYFLIGILRSALLLYGSFFAPLLKKRTTNKQINWRKT